MKRSPLLIPLLIPALLVSSGSTVYYKIQALDYETRWSEALCQLETALRTPKQFRDVEKPICSAVTVPDHPADSEGAIMTLRTELAEKEALIARLTARTNDTSGFSSTAEKQSRLEEMKKTDPEKYEELMARREEFRQNIQTAFSQKAATLLDRDTTNLDEKELAQYETLLNLMNETWRLTEKMTAPEILPAERREVRQELNEVTRQLRPLLQDEREHRFFDLGLASGCTEQEAMDFAQYINDTIQATSLPDGSRRTRRAKPDSQ